MAKYFVTDYKGKTNRVPYDYQSVQPEAGKLLCSKMALKRCTNTEQLWHRKLASLTFLELLDWKSRSDRS